MAEERSAGELEQMAQRRVRELDLDRIVRAIARAGRDEDGGGCNYGNERETTVGKLRVRASWCGMQTASVDLLPARTITAAARKWLRVYEASDGGAHLVCYRDDSWVADVLRWGDEVAHQASADRALNNAARADRVRARFTPLELD